MSTLTSVCIHVLLLVLIKVHSTLWFFFFLGFWSILSLAMLLFIYRLLHSLPYHLFCVDSLWAPNYALCHISYYTLMLDQWVFNDFIVLPFLLITCSYSWILFLYLVIVSVSFNLRTLYLKVLVTSNKCYTVPQWVISFVAASLGSNTSCDLTNCVIFFTSCQCAIYLL